MDQFGEEWFGPASQKALQNLYLETRQTSGRVVEIGSWTGRSTVALANACHPEVLHAVDTWEGSPGEISAELAADRDVFAQWKRNVYSLTAGNVEAFRMGWRDYAGKYATPVRFLFVDAEHTYVEVSDTIAAFLPLMPPGAVICGDDAHHDPIRRAVVEACPKAQAIATLWFWQVP